MKWITRLFLISAMLLLIGGCNSVDRFSILKQCTVLGDESIVYARAHYVKLFYHYNPAKFAESYKQIDGFDAVTLRNTINTYTRAVNKIANEETKITDATTLDLIASCRELSDFTTDFVENVYSKALNHQSKNDPLTDTFFIEINQLVKFDHNIGVYDKNDSSFKRRVENYRKAVSNYIQEYRKSIPSDFVNSRKSQ